VHVIDCDIASGDWSIYVSEFRSYVEDIIYRYSNGISSYIRQ